MGRVIASVQGHVALHWQATGLYVPDGHAALLRCRILYDVSGCTSMMSYKAGALRLCDQRGSRVGSGQGQNKGVKGWL